MVYEGKELCWLGFYLGGTQFGPNLKGLDSYAPHPPVFLLFLFVSCYVIRSSPLSPFSDWGSMRLQLQVRQLSSEIAEQTCSDLGSDDIMY